MNIYSALPTLEARRVLTNATTPDVFYLIGWDNNRDVMTCIIVCNEVYDDDVAWLYNTAEETVYWFEKPRYTINWAQWYVAIAYVTGELDATVFDDDPPLRITAADYEAIAREAREAGV